MDKADITGQPMLSLGDTHATVIIDNAISNASPNAELEERKLREFWGKEVADGCKSRNARDFVFFFINVFFLLINPEIVRELYPALDLQTARREYFILRTVGSGIKNMGNRIRNFYHYDAIVEVGLLMGLGNANDFRDFINDSLSNFAKEP